ncbi:hypothetical protein BH24ACT15_BH24ACT15_38080 [soil metagenome]
MPCWAISVWDRDTASWQYVLTAVQSELVGQFRRGISDPDHLKVVTLPEHCAPFAASSG